MPVESASYATQFNTSSPASTDPRSEGDDHLRLIKSVIATELNAANRGWAYTGLSAVWHSSTRVCIDTDETDVFEVGRRVKAVGSATGTIFGEVTSATYSAATSTTFRWFASSLSDEALQFWVGPRHLQVPGAVSALAVAVGDGEADDTTVLQALLNSGVDVMVPTGHEFKITAALTITNAGQKLMGWGQITQATANTHVLSVTADRCEITGVTLKPPSTSTNTIAAAGVYLNADYCRVHGIRVTGGRRGGVMLYNASHNQVIGNFFTDSVVAPATDNHTQAGGDVVMFAQSGGTCDGNIISNNVCISGSGTGIVLQTLSSTASNTIQGTIVDANYVADQPTYGIILYKGAAQDSFYDCVVTSNRVNNISGEMSDASSGLIYGAGIYVQGAESSVVDGNTVRETHTYDRTSAISETLAPGGIGVTNVRDVMISNNVVRSVAKHGIFMSDPNGNGVANQSVLVTGNKVQSASGHGIYTLTMPRYKLANNVVTDCHSNGIFCVDTTHIVANPTRRTARIDITNNTVVDNGASAQSGVNIQLGFAADSASAHTVTVNVVGNHIENNGLYGVAMGRVANSEVSIYANIVGNSFIDHTETNGTGVRLTTAVQGGVVDANVFDGNTYAIDFGNGSTGAQIFGGDRNTFINNVSADYRHAADQRYVMADSATPSLKWARYAETGGTTTITGFTDLQRGVPVVIVVLHSVTILGTAYTSGNIVTVINDFGTYRIVSDNT